VSCCKFQVLSRRIGKKAGEGSPFLLLVEEIRAKTEGNPDYIFDGWNSYLRSKRDFIARRTRNGAEVSLRGPVHQDRAQEKAGPLRSK
jgi:hypothetical protein